MTCVYVLFRLCPWKAFSDNGQLAPDDAINDLASDACGRAFGRSFYLGVPVSFLRGKRVERSERLWPVLDRSRLIVGYFRDFIFLDNVAAAVLALSKLSVGHANIIPPLVGATNVHLLRVASRYCIKEHTRNFFTWLNLVFAVHNCCAACLSCRCLIFASIR